MLIFPAIDIYDGSCVRLLKGEVKKKTIYNSSPINQAVFFEKCGFQNLHIVDLNFAIKGKSNNQKIIESIKKKTKLSLQLFMKKIRILKNVFLPIQKKYLLLWI